MKKTIRTLAALSVAAIAFTGCFEKKEQTPPAQSQQAQRTITVGYAQVGHEAAWRTANSDSFKNTFTAENGYNLLFVDADNSQKVQINTIKDFIAQNVDYIVLAPSVETGWDAVLKEAKEAAIPVILSDRMLQTEDPSLYLCWVGGNFLKEGKDAAAWLDSYLKAQGMESKEINIVDLQGTLGASAQIGRTQGIEEGVAAHSNWNLIAQQSGDFTYNGGKIVFEGIIKSVGIDNIDVVFAENDDMAMAVINVLKENDKVPGKDIIVISFDAGHDAFEKLIAGELNCAVECNPLHGPRVAEIIENLEKGQLVDKIQYVTEEVFDQSNAAAAFPTRAY